MIPPMLFSYHYLARGGATAQLCDRMMNTEGARVLIDSGAFSAHRLGIRIRLTTYIDACKYYLAAPQTWGCIQLDVIGNAEGTQRNLDAMVRAGVNPMPVLTVDAPVEQLKGLQQINKRVCVAGALGAFEGKEEWIQNRYLKAHAVAPDAQLHGLGYIRWPDVYSLGLTTCDSSTHSAGERFGLFGRWSRSNGITYLSIADRRTKGVNKEWIQWMRDCGLTKAELNDEQVFGRGAASFVALAQSTASGLWSMWSYRHGLTTFLAASNWIAAARILVGVRHAQDDGRFDYPKARAEIRHMQAKPKQRLDLIGETMEAIREKAVRMCHD